MKAKNIVALLALAAATSAIAAGAPKKPLAQWTCEDFLAVDASFQPKVVYWATAYAKGDKPEASLLDIEGTETVAPAVIDSCVKNPKNSFWQTLKAEWAKAEAAVKKDMKKVEKAL